MFPTDLEPDDHTDLVAIRRDLHRHPELAFEETRTSALVADRLREWDYSPVVGAGKTGVVTLLEGRSDGPCVLVRADIDALPIREETPVPFASSVSGKMHACGHDAHTAIALTAARIWKRLPAPPRGRIKWVFQPAEEIGEGARAMIADGVLESPKVDAAFGLHVWSQLEVGKIMVTPGSFMAAVDEVRIDVNGRGGHGAEPHRARDPVLAAAHVVTALQQIASRRTDPNQAVVVTIASIHAGDAFNVIPDSARIEGTLRCYDDDTWTVLPRWVEEIATHVAAGFGCEARVSIVRRTRPTINDPEMAALAREVAVELVGEDNVVTGKTMGGEDFSEFLAHVPGCFVFVGAGGPEREPHHSPRFDLDERAFPLGVRLLGRLAEQYLAR